MRILNIGSLNIDYVYTVDHFVRPGETQSTYSLEKFGGGKGLNQSIAAARAGGAVWHCGCIGGDGHFLCALLQEAGVDVSFVQTVSQPTGHTIIQVDPAGQNAILYHAGANRAVQPDRIREVLRAFSAGDILLIQNEISCLGEIMQQAADKGLWIALNPSPFDDKIASLPLDLANCLILNALEGEALSGTDQSEQILQTLRIRYPKAELLLTLGRQGAWYWDGHALYQQSAYSVKTVDTTGAGDTFTGYFLAGRAAGLPPADNLRRACAAAACAVMHKGAAASIPTAAQTDTFLSALG